MFRIKLKKFLLSFIYGILIIVFSELCLWIWDPLIKVKQHINMISVFSLGFSGLIFGLLAITPWGESA